MKTSQQLNFPVFKHPRGKTIQQIVKEKMMADKVCQVDRETAERKGWRKRKNSTKSQ
jgi:hypothetical protein